MLHSAFSRGLARYEFLGDTAEWKVEWTELCRELQLFQAFAPSALGVADWSAFALGRPLISWRPA
jgi:hypothetical protein